jgi:hypothetical protein
MDILDTPSLYVGAEHLLEAEGISCDPKAVSGIDATGRSRARAGDGKKRLIIKHLVYDAVNPEGLWSDGYIGFPVSSPSRGVPAEAHRFGKERVYRTVDLFVKEADVSPDLVCIERISEAVRDLFGDSVPQWFHPPLSLLKVEPDRAYRCCNDARDAEIRDAATHIKG